MLEKCKKIGRFFELEFRALPRSGAFTSRYILNLSCTTSILSLSSLNILHVYLYPFWRSNLDKMSYQKSQNRRCFKTVSDVLKLKESVFNFFYEVSAEKISWKSIEAFSRNPLHKKSKKKNNNREKETLQKQ